VESTKPRLWEGRDCEKRRNASRAEASACEGKSGMCSTFFGIFYLVPMGNQEAVDGHGGLPRFPEDMSGWARPAAKEAEGKNGLCGGCIFWAWIPPHCTVPAGESAVYPSGSGEAISPDQQVLERGIMGQPGKEMIAND
jgi:hypothetical protein